jgi:hypothetical protein
MLADHFIDNDCLDALLADDYEKFLTARANVLRQTLTLLGVEVSVIAATRTDEDPEEAEE